MFNRIVLAFKEEGSFGVKVEVEVIKVGPEVAWVDSQGEALKV